MINVRFSTKFKKQYIKAGKHIQKCFEERLDIFLSNEFDPVLNNHQLTGKYKGYRSINVNGDWRAIYSMVDDKTIIFELMGTHSQLYK